MKVVIADTSPLNYLILVDAVEILPRLYGHITLPDVVLKELTNEDAPKVVSEWAAVLPAWIEVQPTPLSEDPSLKALDPGEHAAILLAQRQSEVLLLIDDASGRMEAAKHRRRPGSCRTLSFPTPCWFIPAHSVSIRGPFNGFPNGAKISPIGRRISHGWTRMHTDSH